MEDVRQGEERGADAWMRERLLARFLRYVRVDTTSDRHSSRRPTTEGQLELARMLVGELADLGLREIDLDPAGFVFALLPSNLPAEGEKPPVIGWIGEAYGARWTLILGGLLTIAGVGLASLLWAVIVTAAGLAQICALAAPRVDSVYG